MPLVVGAWRAGCQVPAVSDVPPDQRKPCPRPWRAAAQQKGVFRVVAGHQNRSVVIGPQGGIR